MDKNAIKKFAVWARTELIARVSLKGVEYGITEGNIEDANVDSVGGKVLTADEKKQRQALIAEINDKGYKPWRRLPTLGSTASLLCDLWKSTATFLPMCVYLRTRKTILSRRL